MPIPPKHARRRRPSILARSIGALLAILMPEGQAGQVWDGGGANGSWSTALNWDGDTLPDFALGLQFGGVLQLLPDNDTTITIAGITFNLTAGAFTLSGDSVTLDGGILNSSANVQTVSLNAIALGSSQTFDASTANLSVTSGLDLGASTLTVTGARNTTISGEINGVGGITKMGAGRLTITANNSYIGNTLLLEGSLFSDISPAGPTNTAFGPAGTIEISAGTTLGSTLNNQVIPNDITVHGSFTLSAGQPASNNLFLSGDIDLDGGTREISGSTPSGQLKFLGVIDNGGVTLTHTGATDYTAFIYGDNSAVADVSNTYTGLTTLNANTFLVLNKHANAGSDAGVKGDVLVNQGGSVDYFLPNQIANTSMVTVNSTGLSTGGTDFAGFEMRNNSDTIGSLFGTGAVGLGSATLTVGSGNFTGVISDGEFGSGGDLVKNTAGALTLTGTNIYTGTTTVTGGRLEIGGSITSTTINVTGGSFIAGNNSAIATTAAVTVSTGAGFEYHATANAPLAVGTLTLNSGAGTTIGGSIGSTLTGAQINVAGDVTPTAGAISVNVFAVNGVATGATGTYTLLKAGPGSTLSTGTTYSLGAVSIFNPTNFTVGGVSATATTIDVGIVAATPLATAYWVGGLAGNPSVWAASNGTTMSNWASDPAGTPTPLVPGAGTAVFFSAGPPALPTDPGSTTLGASMSIASLTVNDATAPETRALTLNDEGGYTLTLAGAGGIAIKAGAGAVTLNPDLILGASQTWTNNSANLLSIGGDVNNGANNLTVTGTGNTTLSGALGNGAGGLTKDGTGTMIVTRNSTYTGDTFLNGGSLFANVDPGAATNTPFGTGTLFVAGGTTLGSAIDDATIPNNVTFQGGSHFITAPTTAPSNLFLTGDIDLAAGTRELVGTTAAGQINLTGAIKNGAITLSDSTLSFTAFIYGASDTSPFDDVANTYTGLTTVNSRAFLVLNKSVGFAGVDAAVLGDILVNPGGSVDYLNVSDQIANTSKVTVNSTGILLTGTQFAGFELRNNTDTIGSLFGNGTVGLGSGLLTVGAGSFSGSILDGDFGAGGQLTKNTAATLTLTGANTFTGNTNINNGTLILDGSVQSPVVFVNFSGTLMGTGTAFHNVTNAGVLAPGRSVGTFRVAGNYAQTGAGSLEIEIGGTEPGQHDLVAVGGQASLDGNLRIINVGKVRLKVGDKVTFLTAGGGVTGEFTAVENAFNTGTMVTAGVIYEPNSVSIEGQQGSFQEFAALFRLTANQRAVASALDDIVSDSKLAKLVEFLNAEQLTDLPRDLDLIAPEELASIFTLGTSQANVQTANLQRRLGERRQGVPDFSAAGLAVSGMQPEETALPPAPSDGPQGPAGEGGRELRPPANRNIGTFITGVGEFMRVGQTDNASGYDLASGGFTLGVDCRINEHLAVGVNVGYARSGADLVNNGRVTVDGAKLGVYATYFEENLYVDAALQGGYNSYDTRRTALQGTARGSTSGGEITALIAGGYDFQSDTLRIGPTVSFQYTHIGLGSFRETGSLAPLTYGSQGSDSLRNAIGIRASYDWRVAGILVRPELRAAWQHEFGDVAYAVDSRLVNGGRSAFTVQGAEIGRESLVLGTGVAVLWNERTSTYVYYDGEIGRANYDSHSVSGGMRLQF